MPGYATDVLSHREGTGDGSPRQLFDFPCRIVGFQITGTSGIYGGIDLHDGTSSSDPRLIRHYVGVLQGSAFPPHYFRIPGKGIRFSNAVYLVYPNESNDTGNTDLPRSVVFQYQR